MAVWIQLLMLILTNLPGLISSLKEIFELFGSDRVKAKAALDEIRAVKGSANRAQRIREIIEKYSV